MTIRDEDLVRKVSVPKFLTLIDIMARWIGSREAACRLIGVNSGHIRSVRNGSRNLSIKMARKILAAYKLAKAARS